MTSFKMIFSLHFLHKSFICFILAGFAYKSWIIYVYSQTGSTQQVTLSCPANTEANRGPTGVPGKRGNKGETGSRGQKGKKGERGQSDDTRNELAVIERSILAIQQNMSSLIDEVKVLMGSGDKQIKTCDDIYKLGFRNNGVYTLFTGESFTKAYCELGSTGNNWLVFQRRINGEENFYRNWDSYLNGFGEESREYWLGLKSLHEITNSASYKLRVDLEDWEGNQVYAEYSSFSIGGNNNHYRLNVSGFSGSAGDALAAQNSQPFTTKDRDNDDWNNNCAVRYHGAWWYKACHSSNLNGKYYSSAGPMDATGLSWYQWKSSHYSMKRTSMKIQANN